MNRENKENPPRKSLVLRILLEVYRLILVVGLCYGFILVAADWGAHFDGRTKFAVYLLTFALPAIIYGVLQWTSGEAMAGRTFFRCLGAMAILSPFLTPRIVLQNLWFPTLCFGLGFVIIHRLEWKRKALATRLKKRRDSLGPVRFKTLRIPFGRNGSAPARVEEAKKRLEKTISQRQEEKVLRRDTLGKKLLFEALRFLIVFACVYSFACLMEIIYRNLGTRVDYVGLLGLLFPALLAGLLHVLMKRVRPGMVLLFFIASVIIIDLSNILPASFSDYWRRPLFSRGMHDSIFMFWNVFVFGIAFISTFLMRRYGTRRITRLRAQHLQDPKIVLSGEPGESLVESDEPMDELERQQRTKKGIIRKFKSQREHSRWYRHPWFSR